MIRGVDLRTFSDMRVRYMAQSKLTTAHGGVAPLPSLEEAQRVLAPPESAESCKPQAARIVRAAATIIGRFFGSST